MKKDVDNEIEQPGFLYTAGWSVNGYKQLGKQYDGI